MKLILLITFMSALYFNGSAQMNAYYPQAGDTIRNHMFTDIVNYNGKSASIYDFRGKWLILDTWTTSCTACIASFPKMDSLDRAFKENVKIIMVGATKPYAGKSNKADEKRIKDLYAHLDKKHHFQITTAFDSILYLKYDMYAVPQILIIDPQGIVKAVTTTITASQLISLIKGNDTFFEKYYSKTEFERKNKYNRNIPFLTNGNMANGGYDTSYLFRSLLKVSDSETPYGRITRLFGQRATKIDNGRIECLRYTLTSLYRVAYFGVDDWDIWDEEIYSKYSGELILDLKDSSAFVNANKKTYAYSLTVPKERSTVSYLMAVMQSDLKNYFGFNVSVKKQEVPVYLLEIGDRKKFDNLIAEKGSIDSINFTYDNMLLSNRPIDELVKHLSFLLKLDLPIFNNTGMNVNINIDLKANMVDEKDIERQLEKFGLRIVTGTKELESIRLSD
ncbi:TlpA family protein disulfide reductase [Chitinophaga filiformis]|uniref:Peroxiredoxin n=1 Tax=Chitinophaga filiformis TaxID=104663 RepID=A0A1G7NPB4_CHIFI|nr:TlpA disulfide reductase family protein [Chitinophaga filiformis]SDF75894.1 Peroxiredoxin [Chitinophaga filiformis]